MVCGWQGDERSTERRYRNEEANETSRRTVGLRCQRLLSPAPAAGRLLAAAHAQPARLPLQHDEACKRPAGDVCFASQYTLVGSSLWHLVDELMLALPTAAGRRYVPVGSSLRGACCCPDIVCESGLAVDAGDMEIIVSHFESLDSTSCSSPLSTFRWDPA